MMNVYTYNQHFVAMMNIINAARLSPPAKGHKHHIIPKCWFKMKGLPIDNSDANLVLLTEEDHLKVHKLAILCSADPVMRSKQAFAVKRLLKGNFSGMHHTEETRRKMSLNNAMHDPNNRRKISEWNLLHSPSRGKHQSKESNAKRSASHKGMHVFDDAKAKLSAFFKGRHRVKVDGKWRWE